MIRVKFFGTLRLDAGVRELETEALYVRDIYAAAEAEIRRLNPASTVSARELRNCRVAVNGCLSSPSAPLRDGDTVSLFPAAAGG